MAFPACQAVLPLSTVNNLKIKDQLIFSCPKREANGYLKMYVIKIPPLTKMDEKSPIALPLVLRHRHDARNVVLLLTMLLLRKIADKVASFAVVLC